MWKIRLFEEKVTEMWDQGKIPGIIHLYMISLHFVMSSVTLNSAPWSRQSDAYEKGRFYQI